MAAIDIGAAAIDRGVEFSGDRTFVGKDNPANATGTIAIVEIWADSTIPACTVGTFYPTNGNTLKCRDSEALGEIAEGSKQTISGLSINVQTNDYFGMYGPVESGAGLGIERDTSGYAGLWYFDGERIDPNDEATFTFLAGDAISLYGKSAAAGWSAGSSRSGLAVGNIGSISGLAIANIDKVSGL